MIANARMYSVNAGVAASWRRLFGRVAEHAGVALEVIAHPPPLPLPDLWRRSDLGCAFICGYPWATWTDARDRPQLLAAPLPSPERYSGRAVYCTDIVVRDDSRHADVASLRGARFAWTVDDSQSGWQAPRYHFAERARAAGGRFFGDLVGPLVTPRAVVDAIVEGSADAGPLDSYWHDLLRRHEPQTARRLRAIASTPMTPIPPLVCAHAMPTASKSRLIAALDAVANDDALREDRDALLIRGFVPVIGDDYAVLERRARETDARGYLLLQ